jgi:synaptic vesicle membrane protein VAT-1
MPTAMRSLFTLRYGGPEVLEVKTTPDPTPKPGQVRIRVQRAGLNFADVTARIGLYPDAPKPPMVVGYEVSGTIDAVGDGVKTLKTGMRVVALTKFGGQADCVCVSEAFAFELAPSVSFDAAAALPVNYLTAHHMLFFVARLPKNPRILLHMAGGGVGLAVIELLKDVSGAEIFGTASAGKHAFLKEMGLHHPIDYRTRDYAEEVRQITKGEGVHLVLDPLGGPDWKKGYGLLTPVGHLIAFGWANMITGESRNMLHVAGQFLRQPKFNMLQLMGHNRTVSGVNVGHLWSAPDVLQPQMETLLKMLTDGKLKPRVDKVFPLSKAADAHRYLQERKNVGKVLFDCTA